MKLVFLQPVLHWTPGLVHDVPTGDADAFLRRKVARRATAEEISPKEDDPQPPPPGHGQFADTAAENKMFPPARVKRKYTRRKGVADGP